MCLGAWNPKGKDVYEGFKCRVDHTPKLANSLASISL